MIELLEQSYTRKKPKIQKKIQSVPKKKYCLFRDGKHHLFKCRSFFLYKLLLIFKAFLMESIKCLTSIQKKTYLNGCAD